MLNFLISIETAIIVTITISNNSFLSGWHLHCAAQHDQQDGGGPDAAVQREAAQGQVRLLLLLLDHGQRQQELTLIWEDHSTAKG